MDVTNVAEAKIAEEAGAVAVMALERVPSDIRKEGGVARMSDPKMINEIKKTPSLDNAELNSIIDKKLSELPSVSSNDVDISELVKRELMGIDLSNIDTTIDEKIKLSLSDIINNSEVSKATKQELEGMIVSKFKELGKILDDRYLKKNSQIVMQNNLNTDNNN